MIQKGIFLEMGIPTPEENAKKLEEIVAGIVGMRGQECPEIWKKVSQWLDDPNRRETLRRKIVNSLSSPSPQPSHTVKS